MESKGGSVSGKRALPATSLRPTPVFLGFPYGSAGKEATCTVGDLGSIPGLGRSPGEGKGLGNSMDCIVYGVAESFYFFVPYGT